MTEKVNSSASVPFDAQTASKRLVLETDSTPGLQEASGVSYVRVFPSQASAKVTGVMGTVVRVSTSIPLVVTDYVSFNGNSSSPLRYFPSGTVEVQEAKFFNSPTPPTVAYDADSNSLTLNANAFGIVRISYTALYDRYKVTHGDGPCLLARSQSKGGQTAYAGDPPNYDPGFLVAEATGWETGSLEVNGPSCDQAQQGTAATAAVNDYKPVGLKLEEDPILSSGIYPYYFQASSSSVGFTLAPQTVTINGQAITLYAGCRVRVYPKTNVTLIGVNCAVGSSPVGSGSKPVLRGVTFSGNQSQGLDYPVAGTITIRQSGAAAVDLYGNEIDVSFKGKGEWVNEVEWLNANTYRLTQSSRKVRDDEIVCTTTLGNNTVPCFTFCQVQYTAEYNLYDVLFTWDDSIGWYGPAMVLAYDAAGLVGSVELQPPSRGGVL